jgi:type IV pilus assembly protein PilC
MPEFIYTAKTRQGEKKQGSIETVNKEVAAASLRRQGLLDVKV